MEEGDRRFEILDDVLAGGGDGRPQRGPQEIHALRKRQLERRPDEVERLAAAEDRHEELSGFRQLGFCHFHKFEKLRRDGCECCRQWFAHFLKSLIQRGLDLDGRIRGCGRRATNLLFDGGENHRLRLVHPVGFGQSLDLRFLIFGEGDARTP